METVELSGRTWLLRLEGQMTIGERLLDYDHYTTYAVKCRAWHGHGRIRCRDNDENRLFEYTTVDVDVTSDLYTSLSRIVFATDKAIRESQVSKAKFLLDVSTDPDGVIDLLAELITKKIGEVQYLILPRIKLPLLPIKMLKEKGLISEQGGQIRLSI